VGPFTPRDDISEKSDDTDSWGAWGTVKNDHVKEEPESEPADGTDAAAVNGGNVASGSAEKSDQAFGQAVHQSFNQAFEQAFDQTSDQAFNQAFNQAFDQETSDDDSGGTGEIIDNGDGGTGGMSLSEALWRGQQEGLWHVDAKRVLHAHIYAAGRGEDICQCSKNELAEYHTKLRERTLTQVLIDSPGVADSLVHFFARKATCDEYGRILQAFKPEWARGLALQRFVVAGQCQFSFGV
jgi:hypothetical protein